MKRLSIESNRIFWKSEGEILCLEAYGKDSLRLRATKNSELSNEKWTLLEPEISSVEIKEYDDKAVIKNGKLIGEVLYDGTVNYYNEQGKVLLEEYWIDERELTIPVRRAREYKAISSNHYQLAQYFKPRKNEKFYGMGTYRNNCFNLKGTTLELCHKNTQSSIPVLYSSEGYGLIWNNPSVGQAELVNNHTMFSGQMSKQIDYVIVSGENPKEINQNLTNITGRPPEFPEWAAGLWQSKLRYETQEELLQAAREYKKRGLDIDVIVLDFFHWTEQGEWKFDPESFPNPKDMIRELKEMGIKLMVSIWPTVDPNSENYEYLKENNYIIKSERGVPVFFMFLGPETYYDATNPKARKHVWEIVKKNYLDLGVELFWLDEAEPEIRPYDYENLRYYMGNGLEVTNIYPFMFAKTFYDGMKSEGKNEIVNLVRCCWIGSQRFGVVGWSGDIPSTFRSLEEQIKVGLNMSMTGISWWTTDIGGFFGGDSKNSDFRELFIRWFQYGVFCPIFRNHGFRLPEPPADTWRSGGPNEIWDYGEEAYDILKKYMKLREQLKEYILAQLKETSKIGTPLMRPLFFDFHQDEEAYKIEDQYLFGPELLIAPVYEKNVITKVVYLPEGTKWVNVNSKETYDGGTYVEVSTPIDQIPVFAKENSDLIHLQW